MIRYAQYLNTTLCLTLTSLICKLQFKQLLVNSPTAKEYLQKEVTIFAPSDAYMEKYKGPKDEQFILNHIGTKT